MKQNINLSMFMDAFKNMDRDYFSYEGYQSLYDFFEECHEDWELDVIAICCDFSEYEDLEEYNKYYFGDYKEQYYDSIEELAQKTLVLETEKGSLVVGYH